MNKKPYRKIKKPLENNGKYKIFFSGVEEVYDINHEQKRKMAGFDVWAFLGVNYYYNMPSNEYLIGRKKVTLLIYDFCVYFESGSKKKMKKKKGKLIFYRRKGPLTDSFYI